MSSEETARLKELGKLGNKRTAEEQAEFDTLRAKAQAAKPPKGSGKAAPPTQPAGLKTEDGDDPPPAEKSAGAVPFDTAGANHVVTIRNGKAVKVWFRDGKEIGAEDAG